MSTRIDSNWVPRTQDGSGTYLPDSLLPDKAGEMGLDWPLGELESVLGWNLRWASGDYRLRLAAHSLKSASFAYDDRVLVTCSERYARLWDVVSGRLIGRFEVGPEVDLTTRVCASTRGGQFLWFGTSNPAQVVRIGLLDPSDRVSVAAPQVSSLLLPSHVDDDLVFVVGDQAVIQLRTTGEVQATAGGFDLRGCALTSDSSWSGSLADCENVLRTASSLAPVHVHFGGVPTVLDADGRYYRIGSSGGPELACTFLPGLRKVFALPGSAPYATIDSNQCSLVDRNGASQQTFARPKHTPRVDAISCSGRFLFSSFSLIDTSMGLHIPVETLPRGSMGMDWITNDKSSLMICATRAQPTRVINLADGKERAVPTSGAPSPVVRIPVGRGVDLESAENDVVDLVGVVCEILGEPVRGWCSFSDRDVKAVVVYTSSGPVLRFDRRRDSLVSRFLSFFRRKR